MWKFLKAEKSVFTKRGPYSGARAAVPSSPVGAAMKAQGLNQFWSVCTWAGAGQVGVAATVPPLFGSPTSLGRFRLLPFHWKLTKEPAEAPLLLSVMNNGNPEVAFSITLTCQPPKTASGTALQSPPNRLPLPKGRS